jgi:hypothetical protein
MINLRGFPSLIRSGEREGTRLLRHPILAAKNAARMGHTQILEWRSRSRAECRCAGSQRSIRICGSMSFMAGLFHRRLRLMLTLALCAAWATTPLIAEMCAATHTHCQRHMPCCPPSSSGGENCSPVLCPARASQRAVQTRTIRATPPLRIAAVPARPALHTRVPVRELTRGMHYSPPVFRLKDDLRI